MTSSTAFNCFDWQLQMVDKINYYAMQRLIEEIKVIEHIIYFEIFLEICIAKLFEKWQFEIDTAINQKEITTQICICMLFTLEIEYKVTNIFLYRFMWQLF